MLFVRTKISYNEHMKRKTDKQEQKSTELRVLKYFLMAAREENITRTAKLLHITQPTLSRQLMRPDLAQKRSTVRDRKKFLDVFSKKRI